jgi:hypothetical protein
MAMVLSTLMGPSQITYLLKKRMAILTGKLTNVIVHLVKCFSETLLIEKRMAILTGSLTNVIVHLDGSLSDTFLVVRLWHSLPAQQKSTSRKRFKLNFQ